ncbi:methylmalonyl-CoA epimerase [soil metagenome]
MTTSSGKLTSGEDRTGKPRGVRLAHVGLAVSSNAKQAALFRDVLGLPTVPINDSDGAKIAAFQAGDSLVELLEPESEDSPVGRFIARRGPGIHHLCFEVPDLDAALARCRAAGIELVDQVPRTGAEGKRIAFLHPRTTGGILLELTEA